MHDDHARYGAEAVGSAMLFSCVIGSGIMAAQLSAGNMALALLGNSAATVAMLFVLITMFGPVSGAQFNPAVTLVMTLRGEMPRAAALPTMLAQTLGGLAAVPLTHAMYEQPLIQTGSIARGGPGQWLGEAVATFALILTIIGVGRTRPAWIAPAVAMVIGAGYWFTSSTSFANPAITLARAMTGSFTGISPTDVLPFILFQTLGAMAAMLLAQLWWPAPLPLRRVLPGETAHRQ
jgi:glycerol uptake facilitator-like aquaporin